MGLLGSLLKVAAPVAGFALGGPAGAMLGSGVSGAIQGGEDEAKANKLSDQALRLQMQEYTANAPLRDKARTMALAGQPERKDLSQLFASPGNVYGGYYNGLAHKLMQPPTTAQTPVPQPMQAPQSPQRFRTLSDAVRSVAERGGLFNRRLG